MIEWNSLPKEPWNELEEDTYLIYLPKSGRVISAVHDAMNRWFTTTGEDEEHVFPYHYISHFAEMDWPPDDAPMINWCEHGNMLVCEECAERHRSDRIT